MSATIALSMVGLGAAAAYACNGPEIMINTPQAGPGDMVSYTWTNVDAGAKYSIWVKGVLVEPGAESAGDPSSGSFPMPDLGPDGGVVNVYATVSHTDAGPGHADCSPCADNKLMTYVAPAAASPPPVAEPEPEAAAPSAEPETPAVAAPDPEPAAPVRRNRATRDRPSDERRSAPDRAQPHALARPVPARPDAVAVPVPAARSAARTFAEAATAERGKARQRRPQARRAVAEPPVVATPVFPTARVVAAPRPTSQPDGVPLWVVALVALMPLGVGGLGVQLHRTRAGRRPQDDGPPATPVTATVDLVEVELQEIIAEVRARELAESRAPEPLA